jgi:hypothetical protein
MSPCIEAASFLGGAASMFNGLELLRSRFLLALHKTTVEIFARCGKADGGQIK